jgi:hypothetical protein
VRNFTIFTTLLVVVSFLGSSYAGEQFEDGCRVFMNDSLLKKPFEKEIEDNGLALITLSYCEGFGESMEASFGKIHSVLASNELGIGISMNYSYKTMCYTFLKVKEQLTPDDMRKLLYLFGEISKGEEKDDKKGAEFLRALFYIGRVPEFTLRTLFVMNSTRKDEGIKATKRAKDFFASLLTGEVTKAIQVIRSVPDKEIEKVKGYCSADSKGVAWRDSPAGKLEIEKLESLILGCWDKGKKGDYDNAIIDGEQAIKIYIMYPYTYFCVGESFIAKGDVSGRREFYEQAINYYKKGVAVLEYYTKHVEKDASAQQEQQDWKENSMKRVDYAKSKIQELTAAEKKLADAKEKEKNSAKKKAKGKK